MPLLEGENVTKSFGGLTAVYDVDFHVDPNEIVGLIGPNGAGKSTLFNLISGALDLSSGVTRFKGNDITALKPNQICRRGIARTFQLIKLFANMTVLENVMLASLFGGSKRIGKTEAKKDSLALLEFVGLSAVKDTPAKELTMANQKWLEVARGLATKPELLLLDEFMAGLNSTEVTQAMDLVIRIRDKGITIFMIEQGITILLVEQNIRHALEIADRAYLLENGRITMEGAPDSFLQNDHVKKAYLGL